MNVEQVSFSVWRWNLVCVRRQRIPIRCVWRLLVCVCLDAVIVDTKTRSKSAHCVRCSAAPCGCSARQKGCALRVESNVSSAKLKHHRLSCGVCKRDQSCAACAGLYFAHKRKTWAVFSRALRCCNEVAKLGRACLKFDVVNAAKHFRRHHATRECSVVGARVRHAYLPDVQGTMCSIVFRLWLASDASACDM